MKPKSQIILATCWIALCFLRIGSRWDELYWFLFQASAEDPRSLTSVDPQKVLHASDAIWFFFGLFFWGWVIIFNAVKLIKAKRRASNLKQGEQVGDADAEEAV
jgi:hypothetical protein